MAKKIHYFHLVQSGLWSVEDSGDMGHTSLPSWESGQMWGLGGVILWERSDSSSVLSGSLSWKESKGTVSRGFKLSMGHFFLAFCFIIVVIHKIYYLLELNFNFFKDF